MNQLLELLKIEGRQIVDEFKLASEQGEGTPQEIADFRENAVQSFIARYYPQSHIVSKGKITDLDGLQSNSIDCLILSPAHPHLIDSKGKFRIIFADGCDAAIEVKPNLARTDELHRSLLQCISVKKTRRSNTPFLVKSRQPAHILENSLYVPFFVFSVKAFPIDRLFSEIAKYYRQEQIPVEHQVDGICIVGVGILKNIKHPELNAYGADFPVGSNSGWYFEKWGDATLLGFLLNLEYSYSSFPTMASSIMSRVLSRLGKTDIERLGNV